MEGSGCRTHRFALPPHGPIFAYSFQQQGGLSGAPSERAFSRLKKKIYSTESSRRQVCLSCGLRFDRLGEKGSSPGRWRVHVQFEHIPRVLRMPWQPCELRPWQDFREKGCMYAWLSEGNHQP